MLGLLRIACLILVSKYILFCSVYEEQMASVKVFRKKTTDVEGGGEGFGYKLRSLILYIYILTRLVSQRTFIQIYIIIFEFWIYKIIKLFSY